MDSLRESKYRKLVEYLERRFEWALVKTIDSRQMAYDILSMMDDVEIDLMFKRLEADSQTHIGENYAD